jgi:hypothetical protein
MLTNTLLLALYLLARNSVLVVVWLGYMCWDLRNVLARQSGIEVHTPVAPTSPLQQLHTFLAGRAHLTVARLQKTTFGCLAASNIHEGTQSLLH